MPMRDTPVEPPPRVRERPDPKDWEDREPMTLAEAAALLWPRGPITAATLRTAYRQGALEVVLVARKLLVTKAQIADMLDGARTLKGGPDARGAGRDD
jgi:hypothetical protein